MPRAAKNRRKSGAMAESAYPQLMPASEIIISGRLPNTSDAQPSSGVPTIWTIAKMAKRQPTLHCGPPSTSVM